MKCVPIILISFFLTVKGSCQINQIDSLVKVIDNTQLNMVMQFVWYPVLKSEAGDSLIKIGKLSTHKLISVLDDTTKGIIAFIILDYIWQKEVIESGWDMSCGYVGTIEKRIPQNIAEILIGGLEMNKVEYISELKVYGFKAFMNKQFELFSDREQLKKNKKAWVKFISSQTVR